MLTKTPPPPYVAVIFTSKRRVLEGDGYAEMAEQMDALARAQDGYLGIDSARGDDGVGITVSYWRDEASVRAWKQVEDHRAAQAEGRARWYERYTVRVAKVERAYDFGQ